MNQEEIINLNIEFWPCNTLKLIYACPIKWFQIHRPCNLFCNESPSHVKTSFADSSKLTCWTFNMIEWWLLLFGGPILALIIRAMVKVPYRPKLLHTPYARPGKIYYRFLCLNMLILLFWSGPWHYLKIICGRIWLAWKLVRHPRVLNGYDTTSKKYEKIGLVATELEKVWELPHELKNREVCLFLSL